MAHNPPKVPKPKSRPTGGAAGQRTIEVRLRPWEAHESGWYVAALDDEIIRWTRESPTMSRDECAAVFHSGTNSVQRAYAVVDAHGGALLGNLGISLTGDEAELSYWIAGESRGRGAATAALVAGTELALRDLGVTSCVLLIHPGNEPSIRVARRAGYRHTGTRPGPPECSGEGGLVAVYRYPHPDA